MATNKKKRIKKIVFYILIILLIIVFMFMFLLILMNHKFKLNISIDNGVGNYNLLVKRDFKISRIEIPKKVGAKFLCWSSDKENCLSNDYKIKSNINLYALYEKSINIDNTVSITIKDEEGVIKTIELANGESLGDLFIPTKEGYVFEKWLLNGNDYDSNTSIKSDIELTPVWKKIETPDEQPQNNNVTLPVNGTIDNINVDTPQSMNLKTYKVSFETFGGDVIESQTIESGKLVNRPQNPIKNKYIFKEWQLNGNAYDFSLPIESDITLKAVYKNYYIVLGVMDEYSPERKVSVMDEQRNGVSFKNVNYNDGTLLCNSSNTIINKNDIYGETSFLVTLDDGTEVFASIN